MVFSAARFNQLVPPARRSPTYPQYYGEVWIAGPASHMPAFFVQGAHQPVVIGTPGSPPSAVPRQVVSARYSAPTVPRQLTSPAANVTPWAPMQTQPINAYQFLRAPTGLEAMTGPQFNPAQLLGLTP